MTIDYQEILDTGGNVAKIISFDDNEAVRGKVKGFENLNQDTLGNFLQEAYTMYLNYEKEIEPVKRFNNLEISSFMYGYQNPVSTFKKEINQMVNTGAGVMEVTLAYNYKIEELFNEIEGLQNKNKQSEAQIKQMAFSLEKAYKAMELEETSSPFKRSNTFVDKRKDIC
jgi:hypothetical protein